MFRTFLNITALMCILSVHTMSVSAEDVERSPHFGRDWVRSHPFTLMALTLRNEAVADNDLYSEAGLNTMLPWRDRDEVVLSAKRQNLPWIYHLSHRKDSRDKDFKNIVSSWLSKHPGCVGVQVWDEPKLSDMREIAEITNWLKEAYPDLLIYTNMLPIEPVGNPRYSPGRAGLPQEGNETYPYSYEDSISDCLDIIQPDLLMTDVYPFWEGAPNSLDSDKYLLEKYYLTLTNIRDAALEAGIPYWMFVQAYKDVGRVRYPSESDLRMQVFSTLAYGFTGIAYYTYDLVEEGSMLDADHRPTPIYHHIAKLNTEVENIGRALRFLTSVDVRYVPGYSTQNGKKISNPIPLGLKPYRSNSWAATIVKDIVIQKRGPKKNVLLGYFEDDDGGLYFLVVNLFQGEGVSADDATLPTTITLAPSVDSLAMLSRQTGQPVPVELKNGSFTIDLPGGTGELFKIGDGDFPGLDAASSVSSR